MKIKNILLALTFISFVHASTPDFEDTVSTGRFLISARELFTIKINTLELEEQTKIALANPRFHQSMSGPFYSTLEATNKKVAKLFTAMCSPDSKMGSLSWAYNEEEGYKIAAEGEFLCISPYQQLIIEFARELRQTITDKLNRETISEEPSNTWEYAAQYENEALQLLFLPFPKALEKINTTFSGIDVYGESVQQKKDMLIATLTVVTRNEDIA